MVETPRAVFAIRCAGLQLRTAELLKPPYITGTPYEDLREYVVALHGTMQFTRMLEPEPVHEENVPPVALHMSDAYLVMQAQL